MNRKLFGPLFLAVACSLLVVQPAASAERKIFGWGGTGGGNLEAYGKNHTEQPDRAGDFFFVYGGEPGMGNIEYLNYNGTGWTKTMALDNLGNLDVLGRVRASEVVVETPSGWPDYVFAEDYKLPSLDELELFVEENKHLPGLPSATEIAAEGQKIGEMNKLLLQKVEELTLYMIDLKKQNQRLAEKIDELEHSKR